MALKFVLSFNSHPLLLLSFILTLSELRQTLCLIHSQCLCLFLSFSISVFFVYPISCLLQRYLKHSFFPLLKLFPPQSPNRTWLQPPPRSNSAQTNHLYLKYRGSAGICVPLCVWFPSRKCVCCLFTPLSLWRTRWRQGLFPIRVLLVCLKMRSRC